ncbi:MAG: SBBP repeat-containing protein [Acidobacteria bacterium]|nr:SBBP repeat-containing protein [Acidobacteriota bacterium]
MRKTAVMVLLGAIVPVSLSGQLPGHLPLVFEPEPGGLSAESGSLGVALTAGGARFNLNGHSFTLRYEGAEPRATLSGVQPLAGRRSYFRGDNPQHWRAGVPGFAKASYKNLYPHIDLVYYSTANGLEHDFIVAPGGNPRRIRMRLEGAGRPGLAGDGSLRAGDGIRFTPPVAYQRINGKRREVACRFRLHGDQVRFEVGPYDHRNPLVIDPVLFIASVGGTAGAGASHAIAVDTKGNSYVTGFTASTGFPGSTATNRGKAQDVFVSKLDPAGKTVYTAFLSGAKADFGTGIAVDGEGNVYITGYTASADFPLVNAAQKVYGGGGYDAFVAKLNPAGTALVYSTYLGGSDTDQAQAIALDPAGNAYITGKTVSKNFPVASAFQTANGGGTSDAFVAKLNAAGNSFVYSTYLGGSGDDHALGIAVDSAGNAYVTGGTGSRNFPVQKPFQPAIGSLAGFSSSLSAFVTELDVTGTRLTYSTYLGGSILDEGTAISVDKVGNVYVTGRTESADFPVTAKAFGTARIGGLNDGFATKLAPDGGSLVYSTFFGGHGDDQPAGIAIDSTGVAYITGTTDSPDFPNVAGDQPLGGGGLFKSTDGGVTWKTANSGFAYPRMVDIEIDPATPSTVYAIGDGIYKSIDSGKTWKSIASGPALYGYVLRFDPGATSTLYVVGNGVNKSTDGGATWTAINGNLPGDASFPSIVTALAMDPASTSTLYAGTFSNGIYKTTDGGKTWTSSPGLGSGLVNALVVDRSNSANLLAAAQAGLYRSVNSGGSWTKISSGLPSGARINQVVADPSAQSTFYVAVSASAGDAGVYKSVDGGGTWTQLITSDSAVKSVAIDPGSSATIYTGLELAAGGVYKSFEINLSGRDRG